MTQHKKHTVISLSRAAAEGKRLAGVTAYSFPMARFAQSAGMDLILVGDTVGMVELGYSSTLPVTMDEMLHHCRAVRRGAPDTFVVGDMPFASFQISSEEAVRNACRFIKEGGCDAVKLEWCGSGTDRIRAISEAGILVMGHVGFTPQRTAQLGGCRIQGRAGTLEALIAQAKSVEEAGAFCIVLEMVPPEAGEAVTRALSIFTIGVGAGPAPRMQMMVLNDLLGMFDEFTPKYVRKYADIKGVATDALTRYVEDVRNEKYPGPENYYS
ncbi:MAG: 3-methyl-2-oxobutanoate hydroxymethyltransferase [Candidatus Brocadiia bacterium]